MSVRGLKVSIVTASVLGDDLCAWARHFRDRGDKVGIYVPKELHTGIDTTIPVRAVPLSNHSPQHWRESDLYLYHDSAPREFLESIKRIRHGLVIWICTELDNLDLIHYADFCVIVDPVLKTQLYDKLGYPSERVGLLPPVQEAGGFTAQSHKLSGIVDRLIQGDFPEVKPPVERATSGELTSRLDYLESRSDIMLRSYIVRSKIPVLGTFIIWVRGILTSHLREPYIDPTFENQVAFNRRVVKEMHEILRTQEEILTRLDRLESRLGLPPYDSSKEDM
ncbi:MAG: hypothetical protein JW981_09840 [Anaerolineae bacterium]|nr:hypothetical protein [Anaerolineae bacterium]